MCTRRLLIDKVSNMRELGGYPCADGSVTQWKRFIRSNIPIGLTDQDMDYLKAYGVRSVIDLRHPEEATMQPSSFSKTSGFRYANISFTDDFSLLGDTYYCPRDHLVMVVQGQNRIAQILRFLSECEGASLFFCFAGKDRTGVISVLLLLLAGVPLDDIVADYQVTYTYIRHSVLFNQSTRDISSRPLFIQESDKHKPARPEHLRRTEPEWILPFIDYIVSFGGVEDYLSSISLSGAEQLRLRNRLLLP